MEKKNLCFLICGLPRAIDMIICNIETIFDNKTYSTHFYIKIVTLNIVTK